MDKDKFVQPDVYVEEVAIGASIAGAGTSTTAFLGRATRGPVNRAVNVRSMADYERVFGLPHPRTDLAASVKLYFANGGREAWIVRLARNEAAAFATVRSTSGAELFVVLARDPGAWGNGLRFEITQRHTTSFDARVVLLEAGAERAVEVWDDLSMDPAAPRSAARVLGDESAFVRLTFHSPHSHTPPPIRVHALAGGTQGSAPTRATYTGSSADKSGLHALDDIDFHLLVLPADRDRTDASRQTSWSSASAYCRDRHAFLLVDPPTAWTKLQKSVVVLEPDRVNALRARIDAPAHCALHYPRVLVREAGHQRAIGASGAIAGLFARTDAERGVWHAPAGATASIVGIEGLEVALNDHDNGVLNPFAVDVLRSFTAGPVCWGARTFAGADVLASDWKYIPVRRLANYLELSIGRGLQWVLFEPNDATTWAKVRLRVADFLNTLLVQGALQGTSAHQAYFVRCDASTMTADDVAQGRLVCSIGIAPSKPAEFVILDFMFATRAAVS